MNTMQPLTAPVSVLGHSWPTFPLSPPVHSSLFALLWAEVFISPRVQNVKRVSIMSEWSSYTKFNKEEKIFFFEKATRVKFLISVVFYFLKREKKPKKQKIFEKNSFFQKKTLYSLMGFDGWEKQQMIWKRGNERKKVDRHWNVPRLFP